MVIYLQQSPIFCFCPCMCQLGELYTQLKEFEDYEDGEPEDPLENQSSDSESESEEEF